MIKAGASSGVVFAHGGRRVVIQREDIPPAEPVDLVAGRTTKLAGSYSAVAAHLGGTFRATASA
jgi:hypothetical protein